MNFPSLTPGLAAGALLFTVSCLIQNAMFTWSSRSRNSGDPSYHRFAAWASNGIYFITNALVTLYIIKYSGTLALLVQGVLYTVAASEGSVYMMKKLIAREKGKQAVGHNAKFAQIPAAQWDAVKKLLLNIGGQAPFTTQEERDAVVNLLK